MRVFRDFKVWSRAHQVVLDVYGQTRNFPADEKYELRSQLRRAIVSVPANIAEGCKRASNADFARHVAIAEGSASEADYLILLAAELGYIARDVSERLHKELDEIMRMLASLRLSLKASN